jgi:hypothetical protein
MTVVSLGMSGKVRVRRRRVNRRCSATAARRAMLRCNNVPAFTPFGGRIGFVFAPNWLRFGFVFRPKMADFGEKLGSFPQKNFASYFPVRPQSIALINLEQKRNFVKGYLSIPP